MTAPAPAARVVAARVSTDAAGDIAAHPIVGAAAIAAAGSRTQPASAR
jgi:hypothetical protein